MSEKERYKDFIVNVGGIDFRPVSMATLTLLYSIGSPIVAGGEIEAEDFCVFAWLHAAPIMEVYAAVKSGTYLKKAVLWASEAPPIIFASYTIETIKTLVQDISNIFVDE